MGECIPSDRELSSPRRESAEWESAGGGRLSSEIQALLRVMWSGRMSLVIPQGFLHALWSAVPSFRGYRQQDAQEFLWYAFYHCWGPDPPLTKRPSFHIQIEA